MDLLRAAPSTRRSFCGLVCVDEKSQRTFFSASGSVIQTFPWPLGGDDKQPVHFTPVFERVILTLVQNAVGDPDLNCRSRLILGQGRCVLGDDRPRCSISRTIVGAVALAIAWAGIDIVENAVHQRRRQFALEIGWAPALDRLDVVA